MLHESFENGRIGIVCSAKKSIFRYLCTVVKKYFDQLCVIVMSCRAERFVKIVLGRLCVGSQDCGQLIELTSGADNFESGTGSVCCHCEVTGEIGDGSWRWIWELTRRFGSIAARYRANTRITAPRMLSVSMEIVRSFECKAH